jgi:predicted nucleic acid-binding protein
MIVIVDTNIIFSAILNTDSNIGQILITRFPVYDFYAPKYVRDELLEHKSKLKKLANLKENNFLEVYELVLKHITILDHHLVPVKFYRKAMTLCQNIDEDDIPFVALTLFLKGKLWTGDKKLTAGLKEKGFKQFIKISELF